MKINKKTPQQIENEKRIAEEGPTLENFIGDTDTVDENGGHDLGAPYALNAPWWSKAKKEIWETAPEERYGFIMKLAYEYGRAISPLEQKIEPDTFSRNASNLIYRFSKHLKVEPEMFNAIDKEIWKGIQSGPFDDDEQIPLILIELWEESKKKIVKNAVAVEEMEEGSLAGLLTCDPVLQDKLPRPPTEVFHPDIEKIIIEVSEAKSVPQEMIIANILALASACIGRSRGIKYREDWKEHANLFMLLIAESGNGKSPAFEYIFKDVTRIEEIQKSIWKTQRKQYEEEMIMFRKSKDANKVPPQKPANIQFLIDDTTMEAVSERLEDNPRGLFWHIDEFTGFFASIDRYNKAGGDGKNRLLKVWNVGKWSSSRKSKDGVAEERYIANASIGMFGCIQPHLLKSTFTYNDLMQGLPQRFLYIRAKQEKPMQYPTPEISNEVSFLINMITEKLLSLDMKVDKNGITRTSYLTLTSEAKQAFEHFINLMNRENFNTTTSSYAGKLVQMTLRIALILHFLEWAREPIKEGETESYCNPEIQYSTMCNAVRLVNWLGSHTEAARKFFPSEVDKSQKKEGSDAQKQAIMKFFYANSEFCKEFHDAHELIDKGLKWKSARSLGMYLSRHNFESQRPKDVTEYRLSPFPPAF